MKSVSRRHQRFVALLLRRLERPAERLEAELANEPRAARGRRLARDQAARIAAAEGVARQLLGRGAVGLDQQRREILRLVLILEAVDEIFGRKLVGRRGLVAEQIANRVVVLAVRQPPQLRARRAVPVRRQPLPRDTSAPGSARSPESCVSLLDPGFQDASSSLPGLMRSPPACAMRLVGLFSSSEASGRSRSTSVTSDLPNASTRSGAASGSGKWRRVADATPSELWQERQAAFSST